MPDNHEPVGATSKKDTVTTFVRQIEQRLRGKSDPAVRSAAPSPPPHSCLPLPPKPCFELEAPVTLTAAGLLGDDARQPLLDNSAGEVQILPLTEILDSPFQPRRRAITKKDVAELMASILATGQVTPILVSPGADQPGKFHVHAGHRRCAALRFLGLHTVNAIVRSDMTEREARKIALADNLGREDLCAVEQAAAIRDFAEAFEMTFEAAAKELGIQERTGFRLKAILGASEAMQKILADHAVPAKPADLLARLEAASAKRAMRLAEQYVAGSITSDDLENAIRSGKKTVRRPAAGQRVDFHQDDRVVSLNVRLVRETLSPDDQQRVREAVAQLLGQLGIQTLNAQGTVQEAPAT